MFNLGRGAQGLDLKGLMKRVLWYEEVAPKADSFGWSGGFRYSAPSVCYFQCCIDPREQDDLSTGS